jgi:choline dehydrogenase
MQNHSGVTGLIKQDPAHLLAFQLGTANLDLSGNVVGGYNLGPATGVRVYQASTIPQFPPFGPFLVAHGIQTALGIDGIPAITILGFKVRDNSLGTVKINSKDPLANPNVDFHFYQDVVPPTDLDQAVQMFKVIANIAKQYGQPVLYPPNSHYPAPFGTAPDDSLLRSDAKDTTLIGAWHASDTCRMATSAATGVVDGNLNVFGVTGLSIADNSVMPLINNGGTAWPAYIIGLQKAKIEGAPVPF